MVETSKYLCENITGCKLAYTQSDEISLLLTDYDSTETMPWFENNLQKLVSVSASMATLAFNKIFADKCALLFDDAKADCAYSAGVRDISAYRAALSKSLKKGATFDSRAFVLPKEEVVNYFIWRQQDATRNSILMVAQSLFPHNEIQGIKCDELQEKLFAERNVNWNDYPVPQKRGTCIIKRTVIQNGAERRKWTADNNIPIFTKDRDYIDTLVYGKTTE